MGKRTTFESSDEEVEEREHKSHKKEKKEKREERQRDRERSPRKSDRHEERREHNDNRHRDRDRDQGRERDGRDSQRVQDYGRRRERDDFRRKDYNNRNRNEDRSRLSAEEIKAQRKALWGNKTKEAQEPEEATSSAPVAKNEKLWSSAIAATGVDDSKANKFMRLMGVKNAPKPAGDSTKLSDEKHRQEKMLSDLEKQYVVARETAHMGRGNGLGFH